jgi:gluconokinase
MSNLGVNAMQSSIAALTIGTSGAIRVMIDQPLVDKKQGLSPMLWMKHIGL